MWKLKRYLKRYRKQVIIGPAFKLMEAIIELIVPLVMARIIDIGVKNQDAGYVLRTGLIVLLLGVAGLGFALICQRCAAVASQGVGTSVRNDLFAHIQSFSHAEMDRFGTPSLITRMINDVNQLQFAVAMLIRLVIRAPFLVIGSVIMALLLDWQLSLVFFITTPIIALILYLVMSKSIPFYRVIQKKLDRISLITRENLSGARVIRAFSKQQTEESRFYEASDDQTQTAVRVGRLSALLNPLTYVVINLGIVAILWFGGMRVDSGALTQGEIIALVNYMTQILLALVVVANLVVTFTKASACASRVNEVFETSPSIRGEARESPAPVAGSPKISFEAVGFAYAGAPETVLENITLSVQPGETLGIIGATGSGKSTLVQLIPRFYDVTSGRLLVDGLDVKAYPLPVLRKKIGMVAQQAELFSGTIESNLRWGGGDASEEQIKQALSISQAKEFVEKLPDGLQTVVDQGGKNLSGGQKQRLTIARALAANPEILILDDSASALDFATDAALRKAIRQQTKEMTVLIVSQRVGTIRSADQIVVLDDGGIAGIGKHADLVKSCAVYREICLSQLSEKEVENA